MSLRLLVGVFFLCVAGLAHAQVIPPTALKVIYHLPAGSINSPVGELVQGADGSLYGVLLAGGTFAQGSIFKLDSTGQFQTLYSFGSVASPAAAPNGAVPESGLIFGADGNLYGTTSQGGPGYGGTVYKITTMGQLTTLVAFDELGADPWQPFAPLYLGADGNFYGSTTEGGAGSAGTIFRMTPAGVMTVLHSFAADGSEGGGVRGAVVITADGTLYGATSGGGLDPNAGTGTLFKVAPDGTFSVLHYFPYTASNLISGLVAGPIGAFYGVTEISETGSGNVFSLTPDGTYADLYDFGCSCGTPAGSQPVGSLTVGSDGNLYGATGFGGTANSGTLFQMTPAGVVTPLHSFVVADGGTPAGGLVQGRDGRFYGMTSGEFTADPTIYSFALPPTVPPTQLVALAKDGVVDLTWTAVIGASSYNVYQSTSAGAEGNTAATTGLTVTTSTVPGLKDGTPYYFKVQAVNEAGSGPESAEVTAEPIAAPTNLAATAGNGSLSLSWSAAAGAVSYDVYLGTSAGAEVTVPIASGITSTSYSLPELTNGTTYFVKIASVNGSTTVEGTAEVSATPVAPSKGSGGGSMDGGVLALLGLLTLATRRNRATGVSYQALGGTRKKLIGSTFICSFLSACGGGGDGAAPTFTVGGTVSGLSTGASVIVAIGGADPLTVAANGPFVFSTAIASGSSYSVAVTTAPTNESCTISSGAGTVGSANVTDVIIKCALNTYTIGGTVTGLASGSSVVLLDNGGDSVTVKSNSVFTFPSAIAIGSPYAVTVGSQPTNQSCSVTAGSGMVTTANVSAVSVNCVPATFTIGGTVEGMAPGTNIILKSNSGDAITVSLNSGFTFPTAVAIGGQYNVTIATQPAYQGCSVVGGSGQVAAANVTGIQIRCPVFNVIYNMGYGAYGKYPQSGLIVGRDGYYYGTTEYGGLLNAGTVYQVTPSGTVNVIANLPGGTGAGGPMGPVLQVADGSFYGTTYWGGANNAGTVFKLAPDGTITTLWSFGSGSDGEFPKGGLVQASDGNLYGTTGSGGATGYGTIFRVTPAGSETVLWSFGTGSDGYAPQGTMIVAGDGSLYGTASLGGTNSQGTIFRITLAGAESTVWNFDGTVDGAVPAPSLIIGSDGNMYGTAEGGGVNNGGTLFKLSPAGALSVVWAFGAGADGDGPWSGVTQGADGNFYGTTIAGGSIPNCGSSFTDECGTVFRVTPSGTETVLWSFGFGGNGAQISPLTVLQNTDGSLFGVTESGDEAAGGTIFQLKL